MPEWDSDTTTLIIPYKDNLLIPNNNDKIKIEIKRYILIEPDTFTLSKDWNNGTIPPEKYMWVNYVDRRGKMLKVSGTGETTNIFWEGWLPEKGFEVIVK